jgi:hypothetical protein
MSTDEEIQIISYKKAVEESGNCISRSYGVRAIIAATEDRPGTRTGRLPVESSVRALFRCCSCISSPKTVVDGFTTH